MMAYQHEQREDVLDHSRDMVQKLLDAQLPVALDELLKIRRAREDRRLGGAGSIGTSVDDNSRDVQSVLFPRVSGLWSAQLDWKIGINYERTSRWKSSPTRFTEEGVESLAKRELSLSMVSSSSM